MVNVLLTTGCNLACPYCFADEKMARRQRRHMSMAGVETVLDFLQRSEQELFRVMGGEPTLHPQFTEIITRALGRGMRVDVLSNATWNDACAGLFAQVVPNRLRFLLNLDHPDRYKPGQWDAVEANIARLPDPQTVTLSFNIFEREPRYEYILETARHHRIGMIRLSFSLPVLGAQNQCLDLGEYRALVPFVMRFADEAAASGIRVMMDNAVPLCIFDDAQMGRLLLDGVLDLQRNARCDPVIDISPDLTVFCCFCLSAVHNRSLADFKDLREAHAFYAGVLGDYQRRLVPLDDCTDCRHRQAWGCQGGCITHALLKHKDVAVNGVLAPIPDAALDEQATLRLAEGTRVRRYQAPRDCFVLARDEGGTSIELDATLFAPIEPLLDGRHTLRDIAALGASKAAAENNDDPLDRFIDAEHARGQADLLAGLIRQGFVAAVAPRPADRR